MDRVGTKIEISIGSIDRTLNSNLEQMNKSIEDTKENAMELAKTTRRETLINNRLDAFKYGLATAICVVPVYLIIRFLLELVGIEV